MSAQDKHPKKEHEHKEEHKDAKAEKREDKHKAEKDFDQKHEGQRKEHERLEAAREPALKEKAKGPEPAPEQVKHVPTREESREKGWEGNVDVPSPKDEDPQKNVSPVFGTEYMEIDSRDLQVQREKDEDIKRQMEEDHRHPRK